MDEPVAIKVPKEVYEALKAAAEKSGRSVEEIVIDGVLSYLDPEDRVRLYLQLHEDYLKEAEEFYARGDLAQAGEKYWGAVAALLNAIGERRGWRHYSHVDYSIIIRNLYNETKDRELVMQFGMAERLHANFYHGFMDREFFDLHRDATLMLIRKLRGFLA